MHDDSEKQFSPLQILLWPYYLAYYVFPILFAVAVAWFEDRLGLN
ncbi:MAG TPA: hypothetical protein PKI11_19855 [Candidatus Hydrogenedentes bacterium]|nr:hypothetical protein [Candidatus Hydrogenedentota bacterium]